MEFSDDALDALFQALVEEEDEKSKRALAQFRLARVSKGLHAQPDVSLGSAPEIRHGNAGKAYGVGPLGCGVELVTPFCSDQSLDERTLRRLVRRQIEAGIDFIVPCGLTGEGPVLTRREQLHIVEVVLDESAGRACVLATAGGNNTQEVVELARDMQRLGVGGIVSVTPYYSKPSQEGLYRHFQAIAGAVSVPIVISNVPGRTGVNLEATTVVRLSQIDNIVGLKESSGNIAQIAVILHEVAPSFDVFSGDDLLAIPVMALGGRGVVSVVANEIPSEMSELIQACLHGDFHLARRIQDRYVRLMTVNFVESNPGPIKAAMGMMGLLDPVCRPPIVLPSSESVRRIHRVLESVGLLEAQGVVLDVGNDSAMRS